jgi:hypothetical protein
MLVTFGLAWPANILNTLRVKSSRGRSPTFLWLVAAGYVLGLGAKVARSDLDYVVFFYLVNLLMVSCDCFLYYHFRRRDRRFAAEGG